MTLEDIAKLKDGELLGCKKPKPFVLKIVKKLNKEAINCGFSHFDFYLTEDGGVVFLIFFRGVDTICLEFLLDIDSTITYCIYIPNYYDIDCGKVLEPTQLIRDDEDVYLTVAQALKKIKTFKEIITSNKVLMFTKDRLIL